MSESSRDTSPDEDAPTRGNLRDTVRTFRSHAEARADEVSRQAERSPYERMVQFMELQRRVWGEDNPDVRESGVVNIERRDG